MIVKSKHSSRNGLVVVAFIGVLLEDLPRYHDANRWFKPLYYGFAKSRGGAKNAVDVTFVVFDDPSALSVIMGIPPI